jgi:serine/threonine protein kinase
MSATPPVEDDDRTVLNPVRAAEAPPSAHANVLAPGTTLLEFEITGLIGAGGFGIVYRAFDQALQREVALKEYMPAALAMRTGALTVTVQSDRQAETFAYGLKSFVNEARLLARFDHPSLLKVYRFWEANGTAYMVMPLYEGVTLKTTLRGLAAPPDERWLKDMLRPLVDAIAVLHREQCFHRDIAPDNILILKDGRPLLLDFGAARRVIGDMTQALTAILKPGFAPIEQYAESTDVRQGPWTDIYALASVVYSAIAGTAPVTSVARMMSDTMPPLRVLAAGRYSAEFLAGIDRALAVMPSDRPQNVEELRKLWGLIDESPQPASAPAIPVTLPVADGATNAIKQPDATTPQPDLPRETQLEPATAQATPSPSIAPPTPSIAPPTPSIAPPTPSIAPPTPSIAPPPRRAIAPGTLLVLSTFVVLAVLAGAAFLYTMDKGPEAPLTVDRPYVPPSTSPSVPPSAPIPDLIAPTPATTPAVPAPTSPRPAVTPASPAVTSSPPATTAESPAATSPPSSPAATEGTDTPRDPATERKEHNAPSTPAKPPSQRTVEGNAARCMDILQRSSLGETLTPDEQLLLKRDCK